MGAGTNNINIIPDPILEQVVLGYLPTESNFVADKIFPTIPVQTRNGKVRTIGTDFIRINPIFTAARGKTPEITYSMSNQAGWSCEKEGIQNLVTQEDGEQFNKMDWQAGMQQARVLAGMGLKKFMMTANERAVAVKLTDTSVITQNATLSGTDQWSDYANSDPIADMREGRMTIYQSTGRRPNVAVLGWETYETLRFHPVLFSKFGYSSTNERMTGLTADQLALVLDVKNVLVGDAMYETAAEGQQSALAPVWGKDFVLAYVNPNPSPMQPEISIGYNFELSPITPDAYLNNDPKWSQYVRTTRDRSLSIISTGAAYLIKNAIA